jgi:hypothetical protein
MGLAFPLGLLLAGLAIPLVLLYILKLRRRSVPISSTLLWRRVIEDSRANAPWERLRRHLLLLLQLLALMLLVLALAGPYRRAQLSLTHDSILVLDVSASMGARLHGSERTRMDEAKQRARELLLSVGGARRAALVLAGPEPLVAAPLSADEPRLFAALDAARALEAPADLAAALELASTLARGLDHADVVLVTDAAFAADPTLADAVSRCRVVEVGDDAENVGIAAAALRSVASRLGTHEVLVGISGRLAEPERATLVLEAVDDARDPPEGPVFHEIAREDIVVETGTRLSRVLSVDAQPGALLRARLLPSREDALSADDAAWLVVPQRERLRVLLVSEAPFLLEHALRAVPGVDVSIASALPASVAGVDLVVIDGPLPAVLPSAPVLAFGEPFAAGARARKIEHPVIARVEDRHPALRHARLQELSIGSAWTSPLPPGGRAIVESGDGPIAAAWSAPGGRALAFWFDLVETDLPLRVAFPVLVADAVDWLTERAGDEGTWPSGRARSVAVAGSQVDLVGPDGSRRRLEIRDGSVQLPALTPCGAWRLEGVASRSLGVSLLSPTETDIAPRPLAAPRQAVAAAQREGAGAASGRSPLWPLATALAALVLVAEWAVYHRRRE